MMFFEPEQMEDVAIDPITRTGKLAKKVEDIEEQLTDGNTIRYVTGINATVATTGLVLGSTALSPLVSLLFLIGVSGATAAYIAYVLHESTKLKINPVWMPTTAGEVDQVLAEILPMQERILWTAIDNFGLEAVEELEKQGHLDYLLRSIKAIKVRSRETALEDFGDAIEQIGDYYFPQQRTLPTIPQPSADRTDRSSSRRALPTQEPDYWDDLPEDNHRTSDRYLLPTATADNLPKVRDLPQEIATLKRHVLFVASTTSGKTTALIQVISHALSNGHQVTVLDGKGNLALKNSGAVYRHCNTPERAKDAIDILERTVATMETRQDLALKGHTDFTPITIIIDELNLVRAFLKKVSKEALDTFTELIVHILLQGAASNIFLRLAAHTSRLPKLGLDGGEADSLSFVALGRNGSYESLEDCLDYQVNGRKSKKFQDELDSLIHADFPETLSFSTIAPMGFYRLPWVDQTPAAFAPKPELDIRSSLDRLYQSATAPEPTVKKSYSPTPKTSLASPMKEIFEYAKTQETVKARDIQNNVTGCKKIPPDEIRLIFLELEELEYGYTEGEGIQLSFSPYS